MIFFDIDINKLSIDHIKIYLYRFDSVEKVSYNNF